VNRWKDFSGSPETVMRRFTGIELGILLLAGTFLVVGADMVFYPTEMNVFHQVYRRMHAAVEHISKDRSQIYGILAMLFGLGLVWMVFTGRRK